MHSWLPHTRSRGLHVVICGMFMPVACVMALNISGLSVSDGRATVELPARRDRYYILYRGVQPGAVTTPVRVLLGDCSPVRVGGLHINDKEGTFFRVATVPKESPLDTDGDQLHDLYELRHDAHAPLTKEERPESGFLNGKAVVRVDLDVDLGDGLLGEGEILEDLPARVPFGDALGDGAEVGLPRGCWAAPHKTWPPPEEFDEEKENFPLAFERETVAYGNALGSNVVRKINQWYSEGTAAGLSQDRFRSLDGGHSQLGSGFPQLKREAPVEGYYNVCDTLLTPRVTMAVQSWGTGMTRFGRRLSMIDYRTRLELIHHYNRKEYQAEINASPPRFTQRLFRSLYENNVVLVAPAAKSYARAGAMLRDRFAFLSPFYLHSAGFSGSDRSLLKPVVYASAALPRDLKTRILRKGMLAPTMMFLFKSSIADIETAAAHKPAYRLPAEAHTAEATDLKAREEEKQKKSFLKTLIGKAHNLTHIPPVARIKLLKEPEWESDSREVAGRGPKFFSNQLYGITAALKPGETLTMHLSLTSSWVAKGYSLQGIYVATLREPEGGDGTEGGEEPGAAATSITMLDKSKVEMRIRVPWQQAATESKGLARTDILLLVRDESLSSAPAYVSVRHIQEEELADYGLE